MIDDQDPPSVRLDYILKSKLQGWARSVQLIGLTGWSCGLNVDSRLDPGTSFVQVQV